LADYCRFNGQARDGKQALEDIHWRASYELYADVLLVSSLVDTLTTVAQVQSNYPFTLLRWNF